MQTLVAIARNIRHRIRDGGIYTDIEAILTTHEKTNAIINEQIVETNQLNTIRFNIPFVEMEQLIQNLTQWRDDAKAERDRLSLNTENPDG